MLDAADVAGYLLDQGLLGPRAIVDGGLRIDDRSGLNRVFVATATGERCLVLKTGPGVAREAAVLERLRLADASGGLTASLPAIVAHDRAERVLVLESPPGDVTSPSITPTAGSHALSHAPPAARSPVCTRSRCPPSKGWGRRRIRAGTRSFTARTSRPCTR